MYRLSILFLMFVAANLCAETHITGDITGNPLDASGNPYIVEQDIHIPDGKKAVIKEGCVFLFKPFTGLLVQGTLLVEGTQNKPVVFTSINDGEFNLQSEQLPNPFDWNGILISRESGGVNFKNFKLQYSVYGIKSQYPAIQLENGLFKQNGQFHFTINDKIQYVQDNIPYSINISDATQNNNTKTGNNSNNNGTKPVLDNEAKKEKVSNGVRVFRFVSLTTGIGCGVPALICAVRTATAYNELWDHQDDEYAKYLKKFNDSKPSTIILSSIAVLGFAGFGISFAF